MIYQWFVISLQVTRRYAPVGNGAKSGPKMDASSRTKNNMYSNNQDLGSNDVGMELSDKEFDYFYPGNHMASQVIIRIQKQTEKKNFGLFWNNENNVFKKLMITLQMFVDHHITG